MLSLLKARVLPRSPRPHSVLARTFLLGVRWVYESPRHSSADQPQSSSSVSDSLVSYISSFGGTDSENQSNALSRKPLSRRIRRRPRLLRVATTSSRAAAGGSTRLAVAIQAQRAAAMLDSRASATSRRSRVLRHRPSPPRALLILEHLIVRPLQRQLLPLRLPDLPILEVLTRRQAPVPSRRPRLSTNSRLSRLRRPREPSLRRRRRQQRLLRLVAPVLRPSPRTISWRSAPSTRRAATHSALTMLHRPRGPLARHHRLSMRLVRPRVLQRRLQRPLRRLLSTRLEAPALPPHSTRSGLPIRHRARQRLGRLRRRSWIHLGPSPPQILAAVVSISLERRAAAHQLPQQVQRQTRSMHSTRERRVVRPATSQRSQPRLLPTHSRRSTPSSLSARRPQLPLPPVSHRLEVRAAISNPPADSRAAALADLAFSLRLKSRGTTRLRLRAATAWDLEANRTVFRGWEVLLL